MSDEWVYLDVEEILQETDKAFLVRLKLDSIELDVPEEHWLPKSQISRGDVDGLAVGDRNVTIPITEWLAKERGLD